MNLVTNFAGPVCILVTPTEREGFVGAFYFLVFVSFITFIALAFYNLVLYKKYPVKPMARLDKALLAIAAISLLIIVLGLLTGTNENSMSTCNDGIWEGPQTQMIWVSIVLIVSLLLVGAVLVISSLIRLLVRLIRKLIK